MNETLIKIMLKNLGVDSEALKAQAALGFDTMKKAAARMERIEVMLTSICVKFDIQLPAQETENHADNPVALIERNTDAA